MGDCFYSCYRYGAGVEKEREGFIYNTVSGRKGRGRDFIRICLLLPILEETSEEL